MLHCTRSEAAFYLESAAWNIETAVILYLENNPPTAVPCLSSHQNPLFGQRMGESAALAYFGTEDGAGGSSSSGYNDNATGRKRGFHKRSISYGQDGAFTSMYTSRSTKWRERTLDIADLPADWRASVSVHTGQVLFTHIPTGVVQNFVPPGFADNEDHEDAARISGVAVAEQVSERTEGMYPLAKAEYSDNDTTAAAMDDEEGPGSEDGFTYACKRKDVRSEAFPGGMMDDRGISPPTLHDYGPSSHDQRQGAVFHSASIDPGVRFGSEKGAGRDGASGVRILNPVVGTINPTDMSSINGSDCASSSCPFSDATAGSGHRSSNSSTSGASSWNSTTVMHNTRPSHNAGAVHIAEDAAHGSDHTSPSSFAFGGAENMNKASTFSTAVTTSKEDGIFGASKVISTSRGSKGSEVGGCSQSNEGFMTQDSLIVGSTQSTPHNSQSH